MPRATCSRFHLAVENSLAVYSVLGTMGGMGGNHKLAENCLGGALKPVAGSTELPETSGSKGKRLGPGSEFLHEAIQSTLLVNLVVRGAS